MNSEKPNYVCFDIGDAVVTLKETYPSLTNRDINCITEQVIHEFLERCTILASRAPALEIERLPDAYGIIRDNTECERLQAAFTRYFEIIMTTLLAYGMEEAFSLDHESGYQYDRFLNNNSKLVLKRL